MHSIEFEFKETQEVKLKADPEETKLMIVGLHHQNRGNSYTVSNGVYTGIHSEYEIELFAAEKKRTQNKIGLKRAKEDEESSSGS